MWPANIEPAIRVARSRHPGVFQEDICGAPLDDILFLPNSPYGRKDRPVRQRPLAPDLTVPADSVL